MKTMIILVCVIMTAVAKDFTFEDIIHEEWEDFKMQYKKHYSSMAEDRHRMGIYALNKYAIAKHNERFEEGLSSYKLKINKYSDMFDEEFSQQMCGFRNGPGDNTTHSFQAPTLADFPSQVDWRTKGAVTEVKDQGQCGACWAFSATGSLEGQFFLKNNRLVSLSDQNLVDCCTANSGCSGGWMNSAFDYVKSNGGISTEAGYPYQAYQTQCRYNPSYSAGATTGYVSIPSGDEGKLMDAVATIGPVSVAINAPNSFHQYADGVYYDPSCSTNNFNHAVLVVGFGTDPTGGDYWLAKNSWGTSWGMDGYVKMARNKNNACGIASVASYPTVYL